MFICVSDWLLDSGLTLTHSFRKHCGSSWTHGDAWGRMGASELLQERLQFSEFLTRLPSLRRCRITRKQSFLFFVLTPKALRQWKFVLVCVCVLETFSFSTTPYSELQFEAMVFPIYVCELDGSSGTGI